MFGRSSVTTGSGRALGGVDGAFVACSSGTGLRKGAVGMLRGLRRRIGAGR